MGLGLGLLGATAGAGKSLEDLIAQRRADQLMQQNGLQHLMQIESLMQNRAALQQDREEKIAAAKEKATSDAQAKADALKQRGAESVDKIVNTFSPGQLIPMERYQQLSQQGGEAFPKDLFTEQQGIGAPSLQALGAGAEGPTQPGGMKFGGTFSQLQKIKEEENKANQNDAMNAIRQQLADTAAARADRGATPHFTPIQTYDANGRPTGAPLSFNTTTGTAGPMGGATGPIKPTPGAAQAEQHAQAKKDALASLDQLDQSIDSAKDLIGPGAGRVSKLEQLIGNPDPRISSLGTKLLLTKMQVDHAATGTVRAGASPQLLSRWDNLVSQNLDYPNLKASIQAMREILGGSGGGGGIPKVGEMFNGGRVLKIEKVQ